MENQLVRNEVMEEKDYIKLEILSLVFIFFVFIYHF